jgi:hypothetical protein
MTLDFRTDEPVVGLAQQRELIQAVLNASSADETRWLEWKSQLDVSKPEGAFAVAKAILGFANRMPDVAEQWADGHAYLLVGAEEGGVRGVPTHDIEKVDAWLGRYLGEFGRYQFTYVPFDNGEGTRHVMLVDVFPHGGETPSTRFARTSETPTRAPSFIAMPVRFSLPAQPRSRLSPSGHGAQPYA